MPINIQHKNKTFLARNSSICHGERRDTNTQWVRVEM
jgi:hypothetical protein